jgi:hypothetical protein
MTTEHPTTTITLTPAELEHLTGYKQPNQQLNVLHRRGFHRAFMSRTGVVLERAHYDAVCRGQQGQTQQPQRTANLAFMRQQQQPRRAA